VLVDSYKIVHWMNVRKLTPDQVASRAEVSDEVLRSLLADGEAPVPDDVGARLVRVLDVDASQIAAAEHRGLTAIVMTADEVHATRRPIQRDGIHFYNYYSMAGAPGRVAPVILDILCPPDRLPQLNNGHLEPAITVNIGPGDINGRWGERLDDATWSVLRAADPDDWIAGDSYVEPAYCPHSYSLASGEPARIISYTSTSNLADLLSDLNDWSEPAFATFLRELGAARPADLLRAALSRRGYEAASAAPAAGLDPAALERFLGGDERALAPDDLRRLGEALGFDYRALLPAARRHDRVGKTYCSIEESRASERDFRGYRVASMASAPHLPDLTGTFMRVERDRPADGALDLVDNGETHYMVRSGEVTLAWRDGDGGVAERTLTPDGTAWVAPYVEHAWWGDGAVVKLGSGRHVGYLDHLELSSTFDAAATLRRGRRDALGWGYENGSGG
jgi:2-hydroxyethylphosphonate dioxygenase